MATGDATIEIPLEQVTSNGGGLRSQGSTTRLRADDTNTSNEKRHFYNFRGRRKRPEDRVQKTGKVGYDGEEETVNPLGKIYKKISNFSTFTRYLLYVFPLGALIAIPIIIGATNQSARKTKIGGVSILWFFTWIEMVWLSLWGSKTVAHYLPYVFRVLAGTVSTGVRKYSLVISSLEIPLSLVGWAVTSLATFMPLMRRNPDNDAECQRYKIREDVTSCPTPQWESVLQKILAAATIGALIYLAEKTIIQLISINYHRKQFNARIKESKRNIFILGLLYDASRYLFPMYCHEFAEEDYTITDQLNLSRGVKTPGHRRSGSATPMRIIQNVGAAADKLTSVFGHVAQEVTGKQVFNPNSAHSIVIEALEKNRTAEALAKRIWMSFVVEGRESLLQEDITDVLGPNRATEAEEAFWALDRDGNGDISLDEMILTVTEFARDRKSIASSMHDVDQAINVLDRLLAVVAFIIIVLVFVAFLNKSFTTTLATTGTALLSLSFVFAATAQEVLGSCIFLFVKHPYDIGDRVDISTSGAQNQEHFVVEHISLLFTVFRHVQGAGVGRICQIPNIVLNSLWVENVSRSKAMTEQLTIDIAFETPFDDLQILKNELITFVTEKDNSRDFQPNIDIDVLGTSDQSKLSLLVEVKHKSNWSNETIRRSRRSKFMCALVSALKAVPIYPPGGGVDAAGSSANPTYTVGITPGEHKEHADEAAKGRDDSRLVPLKKIEEVKDRLSPTASKQGAGMTQAESKIVDDLTARNPAVDTARDVAWSSSRDDSSTLGERPSIDRSDLEEVRGLLRRESTRGKRKISSDYHPTVPTINEPQEQTSYSSYRQYPQPGSAGGYENQRPGPLPGIPAVASPYRSAARPTLSQYGAAPGQQPDDVVESVEMRQVPQQPQRSPSNPYRRGQLSPPATGIQESEEDEWGNARPYSGV
ncbi:hypothetical protein LTR37_018987 [Vermiconidia calcicola]|uniref:Uncharacterized protein n=1 Tax=Vermiconidia calcicola TaxID=1690605 RepID=A0ACC3MFD9_9PEZI|nr:hypothetical protein LTR37_018987 [Vermiconidia calcicola]